jgi:hypothetical protein
MDADVGVRGAAVGTSAGVGRPIGEDSEVEEVDNVDVACRSEE